MDLHALHLDRRLRRAWVRAADADGERQVELTGDGYERVARAAEPLWSWAHGRLPDSNRTPRDSTLVAFEIDALTHTLRLAYVAERGIPIDPASPRPPPSAMSPSLSWCTGDYDAQHILLRDAARAAVRELRPEPVEPAELSSNEFWESCYQHGDDGWELGRPTPPLVRFLTTRPELLGDGQRALVLGCGRGHEAIALTRLAPRGARVSALDIAPTAVRVTTEAATAAGLTDRLTVHQIDLFDDSGREPLTTAAYDLVLEHTCYCAIDPRRRDDYVQVVRRVLKPNGHFVGLFYTHDYPDGPPFAATIGEVRDRLGAAFTIEHEEVPRDSILTRAGFEWLVCARRNL